MSKSPGVSDTQRLRALLDILRAASSQSAQLVMYVSALGAIALIPDTRIPTVAAGIAGGVGVNLLSNIIERVARGDSLSDKELLKNIESAVKESGIEESLTSNEFQRATGRLIRRLDLLEYAVKESEYAVIQQLLGQQEQHQLLVEDLRSELQDISDVVATKKQSDEIIELLKSRLPVDLSQALPDPNLFLRLFKMDTRIREYAQEIIFDAKDIYRQPYNFGLSLENTVESSPPATGVDITINVYWQGENIEGAKFLINDTSAQGWVADKPKMFEEQEATLSFRGTEAIRSTYGHRLDWPGFSLVVEGHGVKGSFSFFYRVSSATPLTNNEGKLRITLI